MALKTKQEELDLEFEAEYEEEITYTTISGKEYMDIHDWEKYTIHDLDVDEKMEGIPEITYFTNKDRNYDSLRVRIADDGEYVDLYVNLPKPDELGYVTNIRKSQDFYRTCFDFLFSILKYRDERNVVNKDGEEINKFSKVNILNFAKYVDGMSRIGIRITEGNKDSDYNSWKIYKME